MKIKHLKELLANVDDDGDFMIVITKPIPENERSILKRNNKRSENNKIKNEIIVTNLKMSLEYDSFIQFRRMFDGHKFTMQRFGQAFYNHFNLHKMGNQSQFQNLYELHEPDAMKIIEELFDFT